MIREEQFRAIGMLYAVRLSCCDVKFSLRVLQVDDLPTFQVDDLATMILGSAIDNTSDRFFTRGASKTEEL